MRRKHLLQPVEQFLAGEELCGGDRRFDAGQPRVAALFNRFNRDRLPFDRFACGLARLKSGGDPLA